MTSSGGKMADTREGMERRDEGEERRIMRVST